MILKKILKSRSRRLVKKKQKEYVKIYFLIKWYSVLRVPS